MKTKTPIHKFTLVQHSGFGVGGNPQFEHAVEEACLTTEAEVNRVRNAGGLVFDDYAQATNRAEQENYPPQVTGLIPRAVGTFARATIDGLRIYLPPPQSPLAKTTISLEAGGDLSDTDLEAAMEVLEDIRFSRITRQALESRLGTKAHQIKVVVRND